jgi:hypothetical protein
MNRYELSGKWKNFNQRVWTLTTRRAVAQHQYPVPCPDIHLVAENGA